MPSLKTSFATALLSFLLLTNVQANVSIPGLKQNAIDTAGVLSSEDLKNINLEIDRLRTQNDVYAAVWFLKSLEDESIEELAERTFKTWKLGRKDANNGLLLIVATEDRKMRFEVGYGLEAKITDAYSSKAVNEILKPAFRANQYAAGTLTSLGILGAIQSGSSWDEALSQLPATAFQPTSVPSEPTNAAKTTPYSGKYAFPLTAYILGLNFIPWLGFILVLLKRKRTEVVKIKRKGQKAKLLPSSQSQYGLGHVFAGVITAFLHFLFLSFSLGDGELFSTAAATPFAFDSTHLLPVGVGLGIALFVWGFVINPILFGTPSDSSSSGNSDSSSSSSSSTSSSSSSSSSGGSSGGGGSSGDW